MLSHMDMSIRISEAERTAHEELIRVCVCVCVCVCARVHTQSCLTLCDPMDRKEY